MITIGVPIYNEENTIRKSLDSIIQASSNMDANIVLCFNGTTDNSRKIAEEYPVYLIESPKGKPNAIKSIADYSNSEYLIFVDADAIVQKDCFKNIMNAYNNKVMAVTGQPIPYKKDSFTYKMINARMLNPEIEIAKHSDNKIKPFLHGRIYSVRKKIFDEMKGFEKSIGDDTFLSHYLLLNYGRSSIAYCKDANVHYQPVTSVKSWWNKWSRIWKDLDELYKKNPSFKKVKKDMQTQIDWDNIPQEYVIPFICERALHYSGKTYFNIIKHFKNIEWKRLDDTKKVI